MSSGQITVRYLGIWKIRYPSLWFREQGIHPRRSAAHASFLSMSANLSFWFMSSPHLNPGSPSRLPSPVSRLPTGRV
jgi:hypothetical protein